jgi:membrane-bound lytic murein transglycosylase D
MRLGKGLAAMALSGGLLCAAAAGAQEEAPIKPESPSPSASSQVSPSASASASAISIPELSGFRLTRKIESEPADPPRKSHAAEAVFDIDIPLGIAAIEKKRGEYLSPGGRAWIAAVLKRSRPYRAYIMERLAYYGLPYELIYLPVVESEYNPTGVSRTGAAGMWQFMRNSMGGGMRIDDWRDDRRDFMKSTDAALKKLKYNYDYYGDWCLAIGAYNCGNGAMDKSIKKGGSRDFWILSDKGALKKETKAYVPKFLAIASIARYGGRNGIEADWEDPVSWEKVALERSVDLTLIAEKAGIPLELLRQGNAELRYNVTPPAKDGYALKVPARYVEPLNAVLADKELKLLKYNIYSVKAGDTLSALSRHYGVSVEMIVQANPGTKANSLKIGAKLVIPALKDVSPYEGRKLVDPGTPFNGSYTVQKGDSLWSISLKYVIQPELLAERNSLSLSSIIREGQTLKVPII